MGVLGLLGKIALGVLAIATIALAVYIVDKAVIQKRLREKGLSYAIVKNMQCGNVNKVNVGLFDNQDTEVEDIEYSAKRIGDDIKVGMKIYA